ncbi:MAG: hypothetical protein Q4P20_00110 [Eubacteriales bacterium]|nr:hypothetical protein [Eubacteriales bacterium]
MGDELRNAYLKLVHDICEQIKRQWEADRINRSLPGLLQKLAQEI